MKVAVVTVTTFQRFEFLQCLWEQILAQSTLPNDWVIVDASLTDEDQDTLSSRIASLFKSGLVNVVYHNTKDIEPTERKIGNMREICRQRALDYDYIICMDDDDYNFPKRIQYSITSLKKSGKQIAGCTKELVADFDLGVLFQMTGYSDNHSVNSYMAYTGQYARDHTYDTTVSFGEEPSFTKNFSEEMVQLDPYKSVVHLCHSTNTYNKKVMLSRMLLGVKQIGFPLNANPYSFIPPKSQYFKLLQLLHCSKGHFDADIVYYCGLASIVWDPRSESLGGSEQAVVFISSHMAQVFGKKVVVFGNFSFERLEYNGVVYLHATQFSCLYEYKTLILWRASGMTLLYSRNLKAESLVIDLHDNSHYDLVSNFSSRIDHVMVKSDFHKFLLQRECKSVVCHPIPNGIRIEKFMLPFPPKREAKHLIYASCYTRGLEPLLSITWPILKKEDPDVILHVAYGMDYVTNDEFRSGMETLLKQDGIVHHGRLPVEDVALLKSSCGYHLYYTQSLAEIDCISIRESLVAGCTPILSNVNLFSQRAGIHLSLGFTDDSYKQLAYYIKDIVSKPLPDIEVLRSSNTIISWEKVTEEWLSVLEKKLKR